MKLCGIHLRAISQEMLTYINHWYEMDYNHFMVTYISSRDQCIKYTHNSWSGEHFWHSWSQFLSKSLHIEYTMSFDEGTQHKSYAWLNSNMNIFLKFSWPFLIDPIESEYQYKRWLMNAFNECSIYSLNPTDDKRYGWFDGFFLKVLPLHR